jgi:hypothetical protein
MSEPLDSTPLDQSSTTERRNRSGVAADGLERRERSEECCRTERLRRLERFERLERLKPSIAPVRFRRPGENPVEGRNRIEASSVPYQTKNLVFPLDEYLPPSVVNLAFHYYRYRLRDTCLCNEES